MERLGSPDELDRALTVVTLRAGLGMAASVVVTMVLVVWVVWGEIPIRVSGTCMVMPRDGLIGVESEVKGTVREIEVAGGGEVEAGQALLTLADSQVEVEWKAAKTQVTALESSVEELKVQIDLETAAEVEAMQREIAAQEYIVEKRRSDLTTASNNLAATRRLFAEGVVSRQELDADAQALRAQEVQFESAKAELVSLKSKAVRSYRTEEYRAKEMELKAARDRLEALRVQLEQGQVRAPVDGRILELLVSVGDYVAEGDSLVWMEPERATEEPYWVYGYVPVEVGKLLRSGTTVAVEFPTYRAKNYGSLVGEIASVSRFAVSPDHLRQLVKNSALVEYLMGGRDAVIELRVAPELDAGHVTGYRWRGGTGPPEPLTSGMVGKLKTVVERVTPLRYILPDGE